MKRLALGLLPLAFFACAEPPGDASTSSADAISHSKVKLPIADECRDVLAPLALGLAEGAVGLDYAKSVTVSLTSATDTRLYTVTAAGDSYAASFEVELDNDSASKCFLLSAVMNNDAKLAGDAKSKLKSGEASVGAPVTIEPADDDCRASVKLLALAAGVATVGQADLLGASVTFLGEDENRYYRLHVDGRQNDYDFDLETSNDSASKCWAQDLRRTN